MPLDSSEYVGSYQGHYARSRTFSVASTCRTTNMHLRILQVCTCEVLPELVTAAALECSCGVDASG